MIVELPGRCFDASLTVQKHINRFPWCVKSETATSASKEPSENGFSLINLLVLICIIALCPIIMSAFLWTLNRYVESTRKKQKTTVLPSVQLPNWKVMKSDTNGNLIIVGAVPQCNGIGSKSSLKSDSLTNSGTSDATYENSDKVNKSCQSLPVHNSIYESVVHSDYD
uniref:Uncharacterized protein n=1 Tax=Setaria digitata TaxID=48799 RepID=A0A915PLR0_9BILA